MKNAHESYVLGLRLSHLALLRNLDRFVEVVFPALRRHAAGRTTDAAHLDRWSADHCEIDALGEELVHLAMRLTGGGGDALALLGKRSAELKALLTPHVASEEAVLSSSHLPEMISERELGETTDAIARANRSHAIAMASFLASSLEPDEQKALLGEAPWIFRKFFLGVLGARRMRRYRSLVHTPTLAV
jgi:hypothetical protein